MAEDSILQRVGIPWDQTTASECRYGSDAGVLFGNASILWEDSVSDYQGSAKVFGRLPGDVYFYYEWSYGSCSGCDDWEARNLSSAQIVEEMKEQTLWFHTPHDLLQWILLAGDIQRAILGKTKVNDDE